mmetsp:Transcript_2645/g.5937  ORF Transcript_2645/g.5937 Transcript_2645/m.5937 type:complete len:106 (-) Transcript_2645:277-594(-)
MRKEAKSRGVPMSLLNVKSIQAEMRSNPNVSSRKGRQGHLEVKNGTSLIDPLMGPALLDTRESGVAPLPDELVRLKEELMSSFHAIFKETFREELLKMKKSESAE